MKTFALFANCIPVEGKRRSLICDLQFGKYWFIPNNLCQFLLETRKKEKKQSNNVEKISKEIEEYLNKLVQLGLGHFVDESDLVSFPNISEDWNEPARITNSIIDAQSSSNHDFDKLFHELSNLGCKNIQIRFYDPIPLKYLESVLIKANNTRINHIEIMLPFGAEFQPQPCEKLISDWARLISLFIYSSPIELCENNKVNDRIVYTEFKLVPNKHCGEISTHYFSCNIQTYTEALRYNTCLNRKLSVDVNGNLCNCPSMNTSFGNHRDNKLGDIIQNGDFRKIWNINKDMITICKSCEFRYICTDCRAFTSDPKDELSKPLKCGYNPETAVWEDWSTNHLNKEAKDFYELIT